MVGPKIEPCGTPHVNRADEDTQTFMDTQDLLLGKWHFKSCMCSSGYNHTPSEHLQKDIMVYIVSSSSFKNTVTGISLIFFHLHSACRHLCLILQFDLISAVRTFSPPPNKFALRSRSLPAFWHYISSERSVSKSESYCYSSAERAVILNLGDRTE